MKLAIVLVSMLALASTARAQPSSLPDPREGALVTAVSDPPNGSPAPGPSVHAARSRAVPARASTLPVDPAESIDPARLRHLLGVRRTMSDVMTGLGAVAVLSLTTTTVLAAISFADRYGFHSTEQDTACAQGTAVMQEYCEGTVWPQAIAGGVTTTLYVTASMLGMFMPDPLHVGAQPGALGDRIRTHRALRVLTSTLVIAQALLGLFLSHADDWFGLDRQQDFDALQVLAATHLGLGLGALTSLAAQGAVMVF